MIHLLGKRVRQKDGGMSRKTRKPLEGTVLRIVRHGFVVVKIDTQKYPVTYNVNAIEVIDGTSSTEQSKSVF